MANCILMKQAASGYIHRSYGPIPAEQVQATLVKIIKWWADYLTEEEILATLKAQNPLSYAPNSKVRFETRSPHISLSGTWDLEVINMWSSAPERGVEDAAPGILALTPEQVETVRNKAKDMFLWEDKEASLVAHFAWNGLPPKPIAVEM